MLTMRLLLTSDLHQMSSKWADLVLAVRTELPQVVLVAGDLLPNTGGHRAQRSFFKTLRNHLRAITELAGATVLLYLGNDDHHVLEPLLDELAAEGLCANLNARLHRERGIVFCGMNRIRDYPFGYKHWCVPDDDYVACPVQVCGQGLTLDARGEYAPLGNLAAYLKSKPSIRQELASLKGQLKPGEMESSVWMIHHPPTELGMDILTSGEQVGSPTVLEFARENQPLLGCSGHIHESPYQRGGRWMNWIGRTLWIQAGQVGHLLHYVRLDLAEEAKVTGCWHSIFGAAKT
jgi:Icc-related predicted phosphoesterase